MPLETTREQVKELTANLEIPLRQFKSSRRGAW